jgi:type I restriction-modification system DNA methylase subunit
MKNDQPDKLDLRSHDIAEDKRRELLRLFQEIRTEGGKLGDISIYGQESNYTTWRLAKMNLAIRGIDAQIAHGDTFHNDRHPDLKADYVLANPPFDDSDWRGELLKDDKRWVYGTPPAAAHLRRRG